MISLITPTGDRPVSFNLTIDFMINQILDIDKEIQWIVIDDGVTPATQEVIKNRLYDICNKITMNYVYRTPNIEQETGKYSSRSLAANLLEAIPLINGDYVFIIEDDDWYSPLYLYNGLFKLQDYFLTGPIWQCYYNLEQLSFKIMKNKGSSLCSTCFRKELLPIFEKICNTCYISNFKGIDYSFWKKILETEYSWYIDESSNYLCIGMKCLPGRKGIGIGHEGKRFYPDPEAKRLRNWVGEEWAKIYLGIRDEMLRNRS